MPAERYRTKWNPKVDNRPDSRIPRIKFSHAFSNKFVRNANRILDIGCGTGSYTYLIDSRGCFGVDVDLAAIRVANRYCVKSSFIVASASNLPFRDGTFDLIFMWGVMEQMSVGMEKQALAEAYRTLTHFGRLMLSATNNHILSKIMDPAFLLGRQRHYSAKELTELTHEVGFCVQELTIRGKWYTLGAISIFYFYKYLLHRIEGRMLQFFYNKSEKEMLFETRTNGICTIFISLKKEKNENQSLSDRDL